jgi:hypothetical protein
MLHKNIEKNCVFDKISGVQSVAFKPSLKCYNGFSIFPPSFQGNHVKIMDSPATVTAKNPSQKNADITDNEIQEMVNEVRYGK